MANNLLDKNSSDSESIPRNYRSRKKSKAIQNVNYFI